MAKMGRPVKYKTVEELQALIDAYFEGLLDDKGRYVRPPTVTGLALACGMSRLGLINYEKKDDFFNAIKEAKQRVEEFVEANLMSGRAPVGSIFNLKNNFKGWKDKQELDVADVTGLDERIIAARKRAKKSE